MELKQIAAEIAEELNMREGDVRKVVRSVMKRMRTEVEANEELRVPQLGKFIQRKTAAGKVRIVLRPSKPKDEAA